MGLQCGGWTIKWQGEIGNITAGTTILDAIRATVDPTSNVVYKEKPTATFVKNNAFSYAIVVIGEKSYAKTAEDNLNLTLPAPGPSMINNVCGAVKCVVIIVSGRPLGIEPFLGSEGQGVSEVCFGDYEFTGKLPSTPRTLETDNMIPYFHLALD